MVENVYVLHDIVKLSGGRVKGRKKIQKLIYILQELTKLPIKPYDFRWNYYGVYSDELANDLTLGELFGLIKETEVNEYNAYKTYVIEATGDEDISKYDYAERQRLLIEYLSKKETRVLEVLSSIIYFEKEGLRGQDLEQKLHTFKGHLESFFAEAFNSHEEVNRLCKN